MNVPITAALAAALALTALAGPGAAADASAAAPTVHIRNFAFVPAALTIPAGTTVTFVNDDDEPHTVTAVDKSFDSEGLDKNQRWKHTFAKAQTVKYFCEMHPAMKGSVVVTKGAAK